MSNTVIEKSHGEKALASITESAGFYTSLALNTRADRLRMLNTVNNSVPLVDEVGKEIAVKDVVFNTVEITDPETGEISSALRSTLIDVEGNAFHATSNGIVQSMRQVFNMLGEPTDWDEPLKVRVLEKRGRNGFRFLTLDFVE